MAIAHDANSTSSLGSNVLSLEWSHTVSSATNGCVVVAASHDNIGINWDTTATTFNGTAMTRVQNVTSGGGAGDHEDALYVLATAGEGTGAKTIHIEMESGTEDMVGSATSYTGVDQTTPQDGGVSSGGDDGTDPITINVTSATNDLVVGFCCMEDDDLANVGENQTERTNNLALSGQEQRTSDQAGETTAVHHYDRDTTNTKQWTILACNLNVASGASGPANLKTWNTVAAASVKTGDTVAIASIKTVNTVS